MMRHHLLGDSYLNSGTVLNLYRAALGRPNVSLTQDGVGGSTLTQQLARLTADTASHGKTIISAEGMEEIGDAVAAVQGMLDILPHDRFLYVMGIVKPSHNSAWFDVWDDIRDLVGEDRFLDTRPILAAAAISDPEDPGYAADQAAVAGGYTPPSLLFDESHFGGNGNAVYAPAIAARVLALGWA